MKKVIVHAPATVANLVCGFDVLGMAINQPQDIMEVELIDEPVIKIKHLDQFNLSTEPKKNVVGVALQALINAYKKPIGFTLTINKVIKPGSGLGSSAASAAGAVVAANHLLNNHFTKNQLVEFAMYGEELAGGSKHADNVAPCIYGGICLIRSNDPLDIIELNVPEFFVTVVHPQIEIKTSEARAILPKEILLKDAVIHWGNVAGLVAGFMKYDYGLIGNSLKDNLIEPYRSKLIPGFNEVKICSYSAGAIGGGISGSGPSIFMLSTSMEIAKNIEKEMTRIYQDLNIDIKTYVTEINTKGISIIE